MPSSARLHLQKRRFAGAELHVQNLTDLTAGVVHVAAQQIAHIHPAGFKLRSLAARNLQFRLDQRIRVGNRIDANKLQNQKILVRPELFHLNFAPRVVRTEGKQLQPNSKAIGNIAMNLDRNLAVATLRFYDTSQSDELIRDFRLSYSRISRE